MINKKSLLVLLILFGLSVSFSTAQDQSQLDEQEMMEPPEFQENSDMERMEPPPEFDGDASGTMRMRRPPRRRGQIGSGTIDMQPPEFDGDASGTMRMRRPPRRRGQIGSGTMDMQPPEFDGDSSSGQMRRPPMGGRRPPRGR